MLIILQFYLSLENSLCADYVTEKFWKVLGHNVIPVVLNGANMSNIAPNHSYIDFKDFNSIKGINQNKSNIVFKLEKKCSIFLIVENFTLLYFKDFPESY